MIVGGEAVIHYGHARLTGDIDVFYDLKKGNCLKLFKALKEFWEEDIPGIDKMKELQQKGAIFQFGIPPNRIDLINMIENIEFTEAFKNKVSTNIRYRKNDFSIFYIGLNDLIKNKKAIKRDKDNEDLKFLIRLVKKNH